MLPENEPPDGKLKFPYTLIEAPPRVNAWDAVTVKSLQVAPVQVIVPVPEFVSIATVSEDAGAEDVAAPPDDEAQCPVEPSHAPEPPTQYFVNAVGERPIATVPQVSVEPLNVAVLDVPAPAVSCCSSTTNIPDNVELAP